MFLTEGRLTDVSGWSVWAQGKGLAIVMLVTGTILLTRLAIIYCVAAVAIAQQLGVPLTSLVAPAAVAGVALGFGAQRLVQDILAGFFIITARQYGLGDPLRPSGA